MFDSVSLLMMGAVLAVFWFFIIRPQARQAREAKDFQANIDKGSRIVTSGGIHGKIVKVDEASVLIEVDTNVKMRIDKSAISADLTKAAYPAEADKKAETPAK